MNATREKIFNDISLERDRQFNLPGSEFDQLHSMNDWIAIAGQYLTRCADRKHTQSSKEDQTESLIKAAAVIIAALEHLNKPTNASKEMGL